MKKIYSLLLTAFIMLFASFQANAAVTTTLKWNIPGTLQVFVGGNGESYRVDVPENATEYVASIDNTYGSTYILPAAGYKIASVMSGTTVINPMYNGNYRIDMATYNGATVNITLEKIVYDKNLTVNVINGRESLTATMWGTNREISLKTGVQQIPYSSKFEQGIDIQAVAANAENPYLKQNGVEMEWKAYYAWDGNLYHKDAATGNKGFNFADGTNFEIKVCETPDAPEQEIQTATIALNYQNFGRRSIEMIFNITEMKIISDRESFQVPVGDEIRIVFNTYDYNININGQDLVSYDNGKTTPYEFTANADMTINISATEREYGSTYVTFAATDLEGLVLRKGNINGDIIDHSAVTTAGTTSYTYKDHNENNKTVSLKLYQAEVSLKSPKVFIDAAPGYWIATAEYKEGSDVIEAGVATTDYILKVVNYPIVRDTKVVVYVATDGYNATPESLVMRDRQRNDFKLVNGYNEFMIDKEYSSPLSVNGLDIAESTAFSVYADMYAVSRDEETGGFSADVTGDMAMHIFAGRPASPEYTVTAYFTPDAQDAEIVLDRVRKLTPSAPSASIFRGSEIAVTPGENAYLLDGAAPEFAGATHTFTASAAHSIVLGDVALMNITPANGAQVDELTSILISFPNAQVASLNEDLIGDLMLCDTYQMYYAARSFTVTAINGAKVPTFRVTPTPALPARGGQFKFVGPEGLFTVQGVFQSEEILTTFSVAPNVNIDDIPVQFDPTETILTTDFYGATVFFGEEYGEYELVPTEAAGEIAVTFNGEEWVMDEDYSIDMEANFITIVPIAELDHKHNATITVSIPEGALLVSGAPCNAINHTWTLTAGAADINDDGIVNSSDLGVIINMITGSVEQSLDADLNSDNKVNSADLGALINIIIGL